MLTAAEDHRMGPEQSESIQAIARFTMWIKRHLQEAEHRGMVEQCTSMLIDYATIVYIGSLSEDRTAIYRGLDHQRALGDIANSNGWCCRVKRWQTGTFITLHDDRPDYRRDTVQIPVILRLEQANA
jgi:hypothetical protein